MIDGVEEFGQIHVNDRLNRIPVQILIEVPDHIVAAAPWPEPIGSGQKQQLVDAFQNLAHHTPH